MLDGYFDEEEIKKTTPIKVAGHLNIAACHLKLGNNFKCIKACEKVYIPYVKSFFWLLVRNIDC